MKSAIIAALVAAATATASPLLTPFPESRLIAPTQGELLNTWANSTGQKWELCYTSFTMDKTSPAEFHRNCDQYKPTVTVARNSGGRGVCNKCARVPDPGQPPCRGECSISGADCFPVGSPCGATNKGNYTFGGFVRPCACFAPCCAGLALPGSQTTETSHVVHRLMIRGAEVAAVARSLAPPKARPLLSSSGLGRGSRRATDRPPRSAPPARRCVPTLGGMPARISACATVRAARVRT